MTATAQVSTSAAPPRKRFSITVSQELVLVLAILVITASVSLFQPRFLEQKNITDILNNSSYIAVAALGMALIIISGNIDISVGQQIAVLATIGGMLSIGGADNFLATFGIAPGGPLTVILTYSLPIVGGVAIGLVNGFIVAYLRVPAIVVTLGMMSILKGGLIFITGGEVIYNMPTWFKLAQQRIEGFLPVPVLIMIVLTVVMALWMRYAAGGRAIYAVGGNKEAARLSGISERAVIMRVFVINGVLIGIASLMFATQYNSIQTTTLNGLELLIITSAVVGGVSILGGTGTVIGATLGAILMHVLPPAMVFANISAYWVQAVQGGLILLTVLADIVRRRRQSFFGRL
jgi:ribose transport system permease protein/rhamnose transport system permease protein